MVRNIAGNTPQTKQYVKLIAERTEVSNRTVFRRLSMIRIAMFYSTLASAQEAGGDPAGSGVLVSAVRWLQGTLLGTVATVLSKQVAPTRSELLARPNAPLQTEAYQPFPLF